MTPDPSRHHWRELSAEPAFCGPPLPADAPPVDLVVIGAGFTGLHAARAARALGASVTVLEAGQIGQAASGRSNGQVIPDHVRAAPPDIEARYGPRRGQIFNTLVAEAPDRLFALIAARGIRCDPVARGWLNGAHSEAALARLRRKHDAWTAFGLAAEWLDAEAMRARIGGGALRGGWSPHRAGHVNPYALVQGLARIAAEDGVTIHETSPVTGLARSGSGETAGWLVSTPSGRVQARRVLVAANAVVGRFWPGLAQGVIPVRAWQIATEPLSAAQRASVLPGGEGLSDTSRNILAFRYDARGGLAMVGSHALWHRAEARARRAARDRLGGVLPQLSGIGIAAYWEGVIGAVPDRLPRMTELAPGLVWAGIYSGRGVALATEWGPLAARVLLGDLPEADLPVPLSRPDPVPAHPVAVQVARWMKPWNRLRDRIDRGAGVRG